MLTCVTARNKETALGATRGNGEKIDKVLQNRVFEAESTRIQFFSEAWQLQLRFRNAQNTLLCCLLFNFFVCGRRPRWALRGSIRYFFACADFADLL